MRALVTVALIGLVAAGCASSGSSSGAPMPGPGPAPTGPLANLEAAPFMNEVWISQDGQQMAFVFYTQQNVRVSAPCRMGNGQLACQAIQQLRNAAPVQVQKRELTGNVSPGTKVCQKLGNKLVSGHNASGNEDGFCRFPDGSMVSTGALDQYAMRITE